MTKNDREKALFRSIYLSLWIPSPVFAPAIFGCLTVGWHTQVGEVSLFFRVTASSWSFDWVSPRLVTPHRPLPMTMRMHRSHDSLALGLSDYQIIQGIHQHRCHRRLLRRWPSDQVTA